jgi:hypothetical protein
MYSGLLPDAIRTDPKNSKSMLLKIYQTGMGNSYPFYWKNAKQFYDLLEGNGY